MYEKLWRLQQRTRPAWDINVSSRQEHKMSPDFEIFYADVVSPGPHIQFDFFQTCPATGSQNSVDTCLVSMLCFEKLILKTPFLVTKSFWSVCINDALLECKKCSQDWCYYKWREILVYGKIKENCCCSLKKFVTLDIELLSRKTIVDKFPWLVLSNNKWNLIKDGRW